MGLQAAVAQSVRRGQLAAAPALINKPVNNKQARRPPIRLTFPTPPGPAWRHTGLCLVCVCVFSPRSETLKRVIERRHYGSLRATRALGKVGMGGPKFDSSGAIDYPEKLPLQRSRIHTLPNQLRRHISFVADPSWGEQDCPVFATCV